MTRAFSKGWFSEPDRQRDCPDQAKCRGGDAVLVTSDKHVLKALGLGRKRRVEERSALPAQGQRRAGHQDRLTGSTKPNRDSLKAFQSVSSRSDPPNALDFELPSLSKMGGLSPPRHSRGGVTHGLGWRPLSCTRFLPLARPPRSADIRPVVLSVDDEPGVRAPVKAILDGRSDILEVPDGPTALELIRTHQVDCCLLDIPPPGNTREVLDRAKRLDPSVEVALVTAGCTRRPANEAMKQAWRAASGGGLPPRRTGAPRGAGRAGRQLTEMRPVYALIRQVAASTATMLITERSGTARS